jgi:hypothetical protein
MKIITAMIKAELTFLKVETERGAHSIQAVVPEPQNNGQECFSRKTESGGVQI